MASLKESSQVFLHRITRKTGEAHINDLQSLREMCVSDQPLNAEKDSNISASACGGSDSRIWLGKPFPTTIPS